MDGTESPKIQIPEGFSLKEKIFFVCEYIDSSGEKITREGVRKHTGGSDRDLSKLIGEWRQSRAITVQKDSEIDNQNGTVNQEEAEYINVNQYSNDPQEQLIKIARRGAEKTAALLVGEDAVILHLLENPNLLPPDLKEKVEQSKSKVDKKLQQRQQQYDPDFFAQNAIALFK
jgi:hypothetical protein